MCQTSEIPHSQIVLTKVLAGKYDFTCIKALLRLYQTGSEEGNRPLDVPFCLGDFLMAVLVTGLKAYGLMVALYRVIISFVRRLSHTFSLVINF